MLMASSRCVVVLFIEETFTAAERDLLDTVKVSFLTALEALALNCE